MFITAFLISLFFAPTPSRTPTTAPYRFAVIGDTQWNQRIMVRAVQDMWKRRRRLRYVVHVGDIGPCASTGWWRRNRRRAMTTSLPWYWVLGNHELYRCTNPFRWSPRSKWVRFWYGHGTTYHAVQAGRYRLLLLDTATSYFGTAQVRWIRAELARAAPKSLLIFGHQPLPWRPAVKVYYGPSNRLWSWSSSFGSMRWYGLNRTIMREIYKNRGKIVGFFHGHQHSYRHYRLAGIDTYCSGGGGGYLDTKYDQYHYIIVTIRNNKLQVRQVPLGK